MAMEDLVTRVDQLVERIRRQQHGNSSPLPNTALDLGIGMLPRGLVGPVRGLKSRVVAGQRDSRRQSAHAEIDLLVSEARSRASSYSLESPSLTLSGNSIRLLSKFGTNLDSGSPLSRAQKLQRAVRSVSRLALIPNAEVPAFLSRRDRARTISSIARTQSDLATFAASVPFTVPDASSIRVEFAGIPSVIDPLVGAILRLQDRDAESFRQGMNSVRVGLDALISARGGPGDWRVVGRRLVHRDEDWNLLRSFHHLLSRASHAGTKYHRVDLELAVGIFVLLSRNLTAVSVDG